MTVRFEVRAKNPTSAWTFGHAFRRGHFRPPQVTIDGPVFAQVDVRNLWDDGSAKFAVLSGIGTGVMTIRAGEAVSFTPVREPELEGIYVEIDGRKYRPAPVALSAWDRGVPHRVRSIPGAVMSEFHYYSPTVIPHLSVWWYVRAYGTGQVEVETVLENGWANLEGAGHRAYHAAVVVGGEVRYADRIGVPFWRPPTRKADSVFRFPANSCRSHFPAGVEVAFGVGGPAYRVTASAFVSGGTDVTVDGVLPAGLGQVTILAHPHHTRWSRIDWQGEDPELVPKHDGDYLMGTPFVPRYYAGDGAPSETVLAKLMQPSRPFERGDWPRTVGASGSNSEPFRREAVHYLKTGDARAWRSMVAHCNSGGRYGLIYRDETTGEPLEYAKYPTHAFDTKAGFASIKTATGSKRFPVGGVAPPTWKASHAPQIGYPGYLFTGRHSYRELAEFEAQSSWWSANTSGNRFEGTRIANAATAVFAPRGAGWAMRGMMQAIACVPDAEPRRAQYVEQLRATLAFYDANFTERNALAMVQPNSGYAAGQPITASATFQQNFFTYGAGWAWLLAGHLLNDSRCGRFARWRMLECLGRAGLDGGYCWRDACATYTVTYALAPVASEKHTPAEFNAAILPSWRDCYVATHGVPPGDCATSNALRGTGGGKPSILTKDPGSNWAIQQATLALAVDLGIDGAREAWDRMTGASNWNPTGFRNLPDWGIVPRWH